MAKAEGPHVVVLAEPLCVLTPHQVSQIDRYLADVDEFGRITLVKQKGRLRFIERTESLEVGRTDHLP